MIKELLKISRPRFWLYLAGTYAVGYSLGITQTQDFYSAQYFLYLFYFLIPANFFLYGVNDIFDSDTDQYNPKKTSKEHKANQKTKRVTAILLLVILVLSIGLFIIQDRVETFLLAAFLGLSVMYSTPPIRFKATPILDFSSNILYAIPGILGYYQISGNLPELPIIAALFFWTAAMHLFSAIPDIQPDKKANIKTSAVWLGKNKSLLLCLIFWSTTAAIITFYDIILGLLALSYPLYLLYIIFVNKYKNTKLIKLYWYYPYLNAIIGFILWWYPVIPKLL